MGQPLDKIQFIGYAGSFFLNLKFLELRKKTNLFFYCWQSCGVAIGDVVSIGYVLDGVCYCELFIILYDID